MEEECGVTVTWEPWSPGQGREEGEGVGHLQPPTVPGLLALILEPTTTFSEHSTSFRCPLILVSEHLEFSPCPVAKHAGFSWAGSTSSCPPFLPCQCPPGEGHTLGTFLGLGLRSPEQAACSHPLVSFPNSFWGLGVEGKVSSKLRTAVPPAWGQPHHSGPACESSNLLPGASLPLHATAHQSPS